ncbi:MAG: AAA family ATPase [Oscillospiraceae bacterium]|nr:AAA family ATPase [Oscillospiraceae bacterium]
MRIFKATKPTQPATNLWSHGRLYSNQSVFIPFEFEHVILKHVLLNALNSNYFNTAPLLFVQGKKGEGKTFMTKTLLDEFNIRHKVISSSELAGPRENDSVNKLKAAIASCERTDSDPYAALVIDDFHLSIAISDKNGTQNADTLLSYLMNVADDRQNLPTSIILLGNNFTNTYAPLSRLGRSNIITWSPSLCDKAEIVRRMLLSRVHEPLCEDYNQIFNLVKSYETQYIGFFEQVINNVLVNDFSQVTSQFALRGGQMGASELSNLIANIIGQTPLTMEALHKKAELLANRKFEKLDD